MIINRGDVYWIPIFDETGKKRKITHPQVVIQDSIINQSRINVVVVCGLSTNMKIAYEPGNILLDIGEANLQKQSIIVVSNISVVYKEHFGEFIGKLSDERINQIFSGMRFLQSFEFKK